MNTALIDAPTSAPASGSWQHEPACVRITHLDPVIHAALRERTTTDHLLSRVLRISVVQQPGLEIDDLPDVLGQHHLTEGGLCFVPIIPFDRGVRYRATFDPHALVLSLSGCTSITEFVIPYQPQAEAQTEVEAIYPSGEVLPENLLRFYLRFSSPMQRGHAQDAIVLRGPDGEVIEDALYRAPVELWDRSMQTLTVLLDPGRLKRWVGPNVALGPPLQSGLRYTLEVGPELSDASGRPLRETVRKNFLVTDPARLAASIDGHDLTLPAAHSLDAVTLHFKSAFDWASLRSSLSITSSTGERIAGYPAVADAETQWSFKPLQPWRPGTYRILIFAELEDACGNSLEAPFDRPLRTTPHDTAEPTARFIPFTLGGTALNRAEPC